MEFLISLIILLYSIILHELAHGFVAEKLGDYTPRISGRLTLNPISHLDPLGSIILPFFTVYFLGFGFGWARPVPINPLNFQDPQKDMAKVAIAGPLTNIILAILFLIFYKIYSLFGIHSNLLLFGLTINLALALFNLIPIPPLDGSRVFLRNLSPQTMFILENLGFLLVFLFIYLFGPLFFQIIKFLVNLLV